MALTHGTLAHGSSMLTSYAVYPNSIQNVTRGGLECTIIDGYRARWGADDRFYVDVVNLSIAGHDRDFEFIKAHWNPFSQLYKCRVLAVDISDDEDALAECAELSRRYPELPPGASGWYRIQTKEDRYEC